MNKNSSTFCIMPYVSLAMQNNGDISVCNICKTSLKINDQPSRIDKNSIDEFWESDTRKQIISDLENGKKHKGCEPCWEKEATNNFSSRLNFNNLFNDMKPLNGPQVLIIKPGNTCNSACRTCVPETSTSWYSDAYKLELIKNNNLKFNDYIKKFESIRESFSEKNPNFWPVIKSWYNNLQYVDVYGGEPWLTPSLWKSLQYAVDNNFAKNISLQLHTNAMVYDEDYMNLLSKFKNVHIGLSLDSHLEKEFEYIRHKSNYNLVIDNCFKFIEFVNKQKNISIYVSITPSILNIWNLQETINYFEKQFNIDVGFTNYVYEPKHFDIRHLPIEIKRKIINKFENSKLKTLLQFMNSPITGCELYWPKFCLETDKLDRIRNQSFAETFPEWYSNLKPYWDYKTRHKDWYGIV